MTEGAVEEPSTDVYHDALDALCVGIHSKKVSFILDADIQSLNHEWLIRSLEHRIGDRRITASPAKHFLRVSPVTLGRWRIEGHGPPHHKFGRRVVYSRDDLLAWTQAQRRQSTSALARGQ